MTVKNVTISGGAAEGLKYKRRRTSKRKQEGGDAGGAMMQMAAGSTGVINISKVIGSPVNTEGPMPLASFAKPLNPMLGGMAYPAAANIIPTGPALSSGPGSGVPLGTQLVPVAVNEQKGGLIKVELKKNPTHKKVHLNPKKEIVHVHKKDKSRRNRRFMLGLVGMQKRITRAKKIQKKVKEMPIADLKSELIKRNLIKSTSKAPESVLRQIASDAHIVARQDL